MRLNRAECLPRSPPEKSYSASISVSRLGVFEVLSRFILGRFSGTDDPNAILIFCVGDYEQAAQVGKSEDDPPILDIGVTFIVNIERVFIFEYPLCLVERDIMLLPIGRGFSVIPIKAVLWFHILFLFSHQVCVMPTPCPACAGYCPSECVAHVSRCRRCSSGISANKWSNISLRSGAG